jgi:hypothetical protein
MTLFRSGVKTIACGAAITLFSLYFAEAFCAAASVEVSPCENSSQKPIIHIQPAEVRTHKLKVTLSAGALSTEPIKPMQQLKITKDGSIVVPQVAPGRYLVSVKSAENIGAALCVDIGSDPPGQTSVFTLKLNPLSPPNPTLAELLTAAKNKGSAEQVRQFHGVVRDPSGAGISGVTITAYKDGIQNKKHRSAIYSDKAGDFFFPLPEGKYVVSFEIAGFKTQFMAIEIAKDGGEKTLPVALQLGEVSE